MGGVGGSLQTLFRIGSLSGLSDDQLLEQFARAQSDTARPGGWRCGRGAGPPGVASWSSDGWPGPGPQNPSRRPRGTLARTV